ncbi:GH32 C-terminal domain-containing protein [uncultured Turicibacter sp.]|nr:GH32 C-terminal domain-containing protein [uncultured Turicibacter sp.]
MNNLSLGEKKEIELFENYAFELNLEFTNSTKFRLTLREDLKLSYENGIFTLALGESGYGRDERSVAVDTIENLHIYSDHSIVEVYLNNGAEVFTTRIYNKEIDQNLVLEGEGQVNLVKWQL